jgi:glycerate-2-kinase
VNITPTLGIHDRVPPKENVERIELHAGRRASVCQYGIAKACVHAGLRAGLSDCHVIAPAGGGGSALFGIPNDEIAQDADGAVGIIILSAPTERDLCNAVCS